MIWKIFVMAGCVSALMCYLGALRHDTKGAFCLQSTGRGWANNWMELAWAWIFFFVCVYGVCELGFWLFTVG